MAHKPIVAVDIDGVYFDQTQAMLDKLNERYGNDRQYHDITSFEYDNLDLKERNFLFNLWHNMDYISMTAEPGAEDAVTELRRHYDCIAVSSPMTGLHVRTKYERLKRDWGYKNVVLTSRKSLINADILIDDAPHNIEEWVATNRPCVAFLRPWNLEFLEGVENNPLIMQCHRWEWIPDAVEIALGELAFRRYNDKERLPSVGI